MTGFLNYHHPSGDAPKYAQIRVRFKNKNALAYCSKRKFGKLGVVHSPEAFIKAHDLGPDALEIKLSDFRKLLSKKHGMLKTALMDQSMLAGMGNVYTDEVLYQCQMHPETAVQKLSDKEIKSLYHTMQRVLKTAIRHQANPDDMPSGYLLSHRKPKEDCPRCQGTIRKLTVGGRSTYICPACQKKK